VLALYLIRHGTKEAIPFDPPLTQIGIKQAEKTAEYLRDIPFHIVLASPKLRTRQTAEILAKPHALPVILDSRLLERLEWEKDEPLEEFISQWGKSDLNRNYQPIIGESSVEKGRIMRKVIDELASKYTDGNILIVTHGGAIGDLLRNLFGQKTLPDEIDPVTKAPHIPISECSITVVEKENDSFTLVRLNDISHLPIPLI
jgi:broad specificity phosphatase PhoE